MDFQMLKLKNGPKYNRTNFLLKLDTYDYKGWLTEKELP